MKSLNFDETDMQNPLFFLTLTTRIAENDNFFYRSYILDLAGGEGSHDMGKHVFRVHANNKGADQPAHPHRLFSTFVIPFLVSIISKLATSEISFF